MLLKCFVICCVVEVLRVSAATTVIPEGGGGGGCSSDIQTVQNFDLEKYMGLWYLVQTYNTPFNQQSECGLANYTKTGDKSFSAEHSSIMNGGSREYISAAGVVIDAKAGKISLTYPPKIPGRETTYHILDTDYGNFAVVWSCLKIYGNDKDMAWILSRTPKLDTAVVKRVDAVVEKYLEKEKLRAVGVDKCGY